MTQKSVSKNARSAEIRSAKFLEAELAMNPEELSIRLELLELYCSNPKPSKPIIESIFQHTLWLIDNCPNHEIFRDLDTSPDDAIA